MEASKQKLKTRKVRVLDASGSALAAHVCRLCSGSCAAPGRWPADDAAPIFALPPYPPHPHHPSCPVQSAAKRYKVTASGKVMVRQPGKQHLNEKMDKATKNAKGNMHRVSKAEIHNVKQCLPNAKIGGCK